MVLEILLRREIPMAWGTTTDSFEDVSPLNRELYITSICWVIDNGSMPSLTKACYG